MMPRDEWFRKTRGLPLAVEGQVANQPSPNRLYLPTFQQLGNFGVLIVKGSTNLIRCNMSNGWLARWTISILDGFYEDERCRIPPYRRSSVGSVEMFVYIYTRRVITG